MIRIYVGTKRMNFLFWIFVVVGTAFFLTIFFLFILPFLLLAGLFFFVAFYIKYRRFLKKSKKSKPIYLTAS